jgi:hypothetical protein
MSQMQTMYVYLRNEGTDVWRPVQAEQVGPNAFRLLDQEPDDEEWEFPSGSVVTVREKIFSATGAEGLAAIEISKPMAPLKRDISN